MRLSCLILTKNNGKTLDYAMRSIFPYANEIVLLDSGSDDNTLDIAKKYTNKILYHEFDGNFGNQKNYGMKYCTGDWIFILDADELVGKNFYRCFYYLNSSYRSIALPRCHIIDIQSEKQLITPTHYYDWQTRFIRNDGKAFYAGNPVHHALQGNKPRLHCCEANIFHLDFLINDYKARKKKVEYYDSIADAGFPTMYLPENYPYHTISLMELPEDNILRDLKANLAFNRYELNDSVLITSREKVKWILRQFVSRVRGTVGV